MNDYLALRSITLYNYDSCPVRGHSVQSVHWASLHSLKPAATPSRKPARSQEREGSTPWILYFYTMGLKCLEPEDNMDEVLSLPCTSLGQNGKLSEYILAS